MDLSTPRALNAGLGRPLDAYRSVLVAGTNGKGSTCACLEALLVRAGVRVGVFTSPHLVSFRERIRVDGEDVSEAEVVDAAAAVLGVGETPSFFEAAWAMAAWVFRARGVEVAVWEVGLGGRLDATNVCDPRASAVVSVGLDHQHVLGETLEAIAAEKVAVFRAGRPAFTADTTGTVRALAPDVREVAAFEGALGLAGAHQRRNAGVAVELARALGVTVDPAALADVRWPGRCERIGDVVLDCAHNADAVDALLATLEAPLDVVFGATEGKDVGAMAARLEPWARSVTVVTPRYPRGLAAEDVARSFADAAVGAGVAEVLAARTGPLLVTGSCFLVGEARAALTGAAWPERGLFTRAR